MKTSLTTAALLIGSMSVASGAFGQVQTAISSGNTTTISTTTTSASVGQTITLNGTSYVVNAKKVLASGVEYYAVKATTPKATTKYYLRTNKTYSPTVFTQAQYEAFLSTGKVPSFGTLQMTVKGADTLVHVNSGNTVALPVLGEKNELVVYEFINGAETMGMRTGQPVPRRPRVRGPGYTDCVVRCRAARTSCEENAGTESAKEKCWDAFGLCASGCNVMFNAQPVSIHVIRTAVPVTLY
jgi:hypothetical protein